MTMLVSVKVNINKISKVSMSTLYLWKAAIEEYYLIKPPFGYFFLMNKAKDPGTGYIENKNSYLNPN